jgi:hypothetical protein
MSSFLLLTFCKVLSHFDLWVEESVPCMCSILIPQTITLEVPISNTSWVLEGVGGGLKAGGGAVACGARGGAGGVVGLEGPGLFGLGVALVLPLLGSGPGFPLVTVRSQCQNHLKYQRLDLA